MRLSRATSCLISQEPKRLLAEAGVPKLLNALCNRTTRTCSPCPAGILRGSPWRQIRFENASMLQATKRLEHKHSMNEGPKHSTSRSTFQGDIVDEPDYQLGPRAISRRLPLKPRRYKTEPRAGRVVSNGPKGPDPTARRRPPYNKRRCGRSSSSACWGEAYTVPAALGAAPIIRDACQHHALGPDWRAT